MRGVVFGAIFGAIATYSATRGWWDTVVLTVLLVLAWLSLGEGGEEEQTDQQQYQTANRHDVLLSWATPRGRYRPSAVSADS